MPSDEAYFRNRKDYKKESQIETLATKWTKSDDLVRRLDIYLGFSRKTDFENLQL